jgi:hypothetical protein
LIVTPQADGSTITYVIRSERARLPKSISITLADTVEPSEQDIGASAAILFLPVAKQIQEPLIINGICEPEFVHAILQYDLVISRQFGSSPAAIKFRDTRRLDPILSADRITTLSGGIDSTYTAYTVRPDHALHIVGYNEPRRENTQALIDSCRTTMDSIGGTLHVMASGYTEMKKAMHSFNRGWWWDHHWTVLHGYMRLFASVANEAYMPTHGNMQRNLKQRYRPAARQYFDTWNETSLLSTPRMRFIAHDILKKRSDKIKYLCDEGFSARIRVCAHERTLKWNCGSCDKCILARGFLTVIRSEHPPRGLEAPLTNRELIRVSLRSKAHELDEDQIDDFIGTMIEYRRLHLLPGMEILRAMRKAQSLMTALRT